METVPSHSFMSVQPVPQMDSKLPVAKDTLFHHLYLPSSTIPELNMEQALSLGTMVILSHI